MVSEFDVTRSAETNPVSIRVCETLGLLEGAYGRSTENMANVLERIIRTQQFQISNVQSAWAALRLYPSGGAAFAGCLLGQTNHDAETVTLDKKAAKAGGLRLLE